MGEVGNETYLILSEDLGYLAGSPEHLPRTWIISAQRAKSQAQ